DGKVYLFPVLTRQSVQAVLCSDSGEIDVDALELLAAMAGTVLSSQLAAAAARTAPVDGLISITVPPAATQKPEILSWFSLSREDRELHLRAQRFARVQVAQIRLYQSEKVKNGRTAHDLYTSLKEEINSAREAFRREFLEASDSMVDYLHLELVRTLANDVVAWLGQGNRGRMARIR